MKINGKSAIDIFNSSPSICYQEIKAFIEKGGSISVTDDKGWTLLHFCAECWQPEVMQFLIDNGSEINAQDSQGWTPLHLSIDSEIDGAIQSDNEVKFIMTKILIENGADLNLTTNDNETPRDIARAYGSEILNMFEKLIG